MNDAIYKARENFYFKKIPLFFICCLFIYRFNFNDDDYNFIYGVVDELWKNVLKVVSQRTLDERKIHLISRCNINAIFRLFKVKLVLGFITHNLEKYVFFNINTVYSLNNFSFHILVSMTKT